MVLRVYAMWNRSKWIMCLLLLIYVPRVIVSLIFAGVNDSGISGMFQMDFTCHANLIQVSLYLLPPFSPVTIAQVLDFSLCDTSWSYPSSSVSYEQIPQFVLEAMLVVLAITQTLKQSIDMYKATKQWQPNRYMGRLVGDGILYFLAYVSLSFVSICYCHVLPPMMLSSICRCTNHSFCFLLNR